MGTPWCTFARTSASADSTTQLPAVVPEISSALTMSTPAATSVASVREKRAIVDLQDDLSDAAGRAQQEAIPHLATRGVFFQRLKPQTERPIAGKRMNQ